jgi:hypothetical protein
MLGDTRLVLGTRQCTAATALDCPVRPHGLVGGSSSGGNGVTGLLELHDAVMRVIGFTMLQGDADVHRAVLALLASGAKDAPLRGNCVTLSECHRTYYTFETTHTQRRRADGRMPLLDRPAALVGIHEAAR